MNKKIITISITALVLGLFTQLLPIFSFPPYEWIIKLVMSVKVLSPDMNLSFLRSNMFEYHNWYTDLYTNFLDLSIYSLLLLGTIFFIKSKGKEIRLLRFSFSIIMVTKLFFIINFLIYLIFSPYFLKGETFENTLSILSLASSITWLWASYTVIKLLSKNIILLKSSLNLTDYVDAPKSQRFLHHVLDIILSVFICTKLVLIICIVVLRPIEIAFGERVALYILVAISRFIYLVLFEFIFKSTPAKFLTGTRVIMASGKNPSFQTIFLRNILRNIPFEVLSYLGKGNGWHDQWVNTRVVKEENLGVSPQKYLWVILFPIVVGILSITASEAKDKYDNHVYTKNHYENNKENIEKSIKQLTSDYFFIIKNSNYSGENYYLKVDSINQNSVFFKYFDMEDSYSPTVYEIEKYYENNKIDLPRIEITKKNLNNSYFKKFKNHEEFKNNKEIKTQFIIYLPKSEKKYFISKAYRAYKSCIKLPSTGGCGNNSISIDLDNEGWPTKLIDIKNIEGDLEWTNELPAEIKTKLNYSNSLRLYANKFKKGHPYKFEITVKDSLDRVEKFIISGMNMKQELKQIDIED